MNVVVSPVNVAGSSYKSNQKSQGPPPGHHSLVVIIETVRWLLVLPIHPALFAVTNKSKTQHH